MLDGTLLCFSRPMVAKASARRHSSVDTVVHAGQEFPAIRGKQRDHFRDVFGFAYTAKWH